MRTTGIFLALTGAGIIVFFILYQVLKVIVSIPFWVKAGLGLVIVGGILLIASLIKERRSDSKHESFRGVKQ